MTTSTIQYKYLCEKCNFKANIKSRWENHIQTELHKTGQKKTRSDCKEPHKCNKCDFTSKNTTNLKQHYLNFHGDLKERESEFKFYCKLCDYGTFSMDLFDKHNNTEKHNKNIIRHK